MLRSKLKSVAKAKSMATIRRQREHVLYSVPSEVAAGKDVKIVYNPANTSLAGSEEVRLHFSWCALAAACNERSNLFNQRIAGTNLVSCLISLFAIYRSSSVVAGTGGSTRPPLMPFK